MMKRYRKFGNALPVWMLAALVGRHRLNRVVNKVTLFVIYGALGGYPVAMTLAMRGG